MKNEWLYISTWYNVDNSYNGVCRLLEKWHDISLTYEKKKKLNAKKKILVYWTLPIKKLNAMDGK